MDNVYFKVESPIRNNVVTLSIYDRPVGIENLVLDGSRLKGAFTPSAIDMSKDIHLDIARKNVDTYDQDRINDSIVPNEIYRLYAVAMPEGTNIEMDNGSPNLPWASGGSGRSNQKTTAVLSDIPVGLQLTARGGNADGPSYYTLSTTLNDLLSAGEVGLPMEESVGEYGTNFGLTGHSLYISCVANQNGSYTFTFMVRPQIELVEELRENLIVSKDDIVLNKVNLKPLTETLIEKAELSYESFELTPHQIASLQNVNPYVVFHIVYYDANGNQISYDYDTYDSSNANRPNPTTTFTLPNGCAYFDVEYSEERIVDGDFYGTKRFYVADLAVGDSILSDRPTTYGVVS